MTTGSSVNAVIGIDKKNINLRAVLLPYGEINEFPPQQPKQ